MTTPGVPHARSDPAQGEPARGEGAARAEPLAVHHRLTRIEDYEPYIGAAAVERIMRKADRLRDIRVANINSTFYGGGVAEILSSLTLLMNGLDVKSEWHLIQGGPDFFSVTKKLHNALQGAEINLSAQKTSIYEETVYENSVRMRLDHDFVVVHDPQPLPLIDHFRKRGPWVWRCHLDMSAPNPEAWAYLRRFVEKYDAVVFSLSEYAQELAPPQLFFLPAIDPFVLKNRELSEAEIDERLDHYGIPRGLPIVAQISRFDPWKDPKGVIAAYRAARRQVDCTLVLLGNVATDDPEGQQCFEDCLDEARGDGIIVLSAQDTALVNALQRRAHVIVQKSLKEGFGLTVTEAMWKGAAVIGGRAGGIAKQIEDGVSGFLVSTVEEAAERMVRLLKEPALRARLGAEAKKSVAERFLMSRLTEQYLDLFAAFELPFRLDASRFPAR